jgi:hypothetical protein
MKSTGMVTLAFAVASAALAGDTVYEQIRDS